MNRVWKWVLAALAITAVIALGGLAYIYVASEQILARTYSLPPSHIRVTRPPSPGVIISSRPRAARAATAKICKARSLRISG
jgi:hypothetical protein